MQDRIKDLAYSLWQQAGSPAGGDVDFWLAAEAQLTAKPKAAAPAKPKAAASAKPKAPAKSKAAAK